MNMCLSDGEIDRWIHGLRIAALAVGPYPIEVENRHRKACSYNSLGFEFK